MSTTAAAAYHPAAAIRPSSTNSWASSTSELQIRHGGYTNFERPSVPSTCAYGSVSFRCITYSAVNQARARQYTKMMLTGFRDHFVSIRIDWSQARQQTAADAEAALQAFVPALLR
jgi:hypothetical protein